MEFSNPRKQYKGVLENRKFCSLKTWYCRHSVFFVDSEIFKPF